MKLNFLGIESPDVGEHIKNAGLSSRLVHTPVVLTAFMMGF
jgi:hypothetical protein